MLGRPLLALSFVALLALSAAAQEQPPKLDPNAALVATSLTTALREFSQLIEERADVPDEEKIESREVFKKQQAAAQAIVDKVNAGLGMKEGMDQAGSTWKNAQNFLDSKPDLAWLFQREIEILNFEELAFDFDAPGYFALLKTAGADNAQVAKARTIVEGVKADQARWEDDGQPLYDELCGANQPIWHFALRSLLTPEQRSAYEWSLIDKYRSSFPGLSRTLGFSPLASLKAPVDGRFTLLDWNGSKEIQSVNLKKGDPLGFRQTDAGLKAVAGDRVIDLPATKGPFFWEIAAKPR
jgi:hypothetical protein